MKCVFIALAVCVFMVTGSKSQKTRTVCPRPCRCDDRRKIVFCNEKNLIYLPYGIPRDTKILHLQNNALVNSPSLDTILGQLTQLKRLDLSHNKLTSFPKQLPPSLEIASLKNNNIKYIGANALSKMKSLSVLFLDHNNITNRGLWPTAFKGTDSLESLSMTGNLLEEVPSGLPEHARMIRLDNNNIKKVSKFATQNLMELKTLDLSHNQIQSEMIEEKALAGLMKLSSLDMSHNKLSAVPRNLPSLLTEFLASNNQISYIYASMKTQNKHGIFENTPALRRLDLSHNSLKSVEPGAFVGLTDLFMLMIHSNPWQCDCHLKYLKEWMMTTSSIIGSISNTQCNTPDPINGVILHSLDLEALTCQQKNPSLQIKEITTDVVEIASGWNEVSKPPYLKYRLLYGPIKCSNCSIPRNEPISTPFNQAIYWVSSYEIRQMPPIINDNITTFKISGLTPDTPYIVCTVNSQDNPLHTQIPDCVDFRTKQNVVLTPTVANLVSNQEIPLWLIATAAGLAFVVFILIIVSIIWVRHIKKTKIRSRTRAASSIVYTRKDEYPRSLIQHYLSENRLLGEPKSDSNLYLATNGVSSSPLDPTYNSGNIRAGIPTANARREFDIIARRDDVAISSNSSYGSHSGGTMSTCRTDLGTSYSSSNQMPRSASHASLLQMSNSRPRLPIITDRPNSAAQFINFRQLSYNDILSEDPSLYV